LGSPASPSELEAWKRLFDLYLPLAEDLPPHSHGCDPLALPLPCDLESVLAAEGEEQPGAPSVDVVICVHDAPEDVRCCLWALLARTGRRLRLIVVDDDSAAPTRNLLERFAAAHPAVTLIRRETAPHGYALAANAGLRASRGDYVVLLNSDTIVTPGWLERLVRHGERHERVGILGPLSNAAGHQSVPAVREDGAWAVNPLPDWLTVEGAALAVERAPRVDVRLPFVNGFCYAIKRAVLEAVGLLDEQSFPGGYCEENDYSQRARDAGFELAVVDDAYVYHANSRSYGKERRAELAPRNYQIFLDKHGREKIQALVTGMEADRTLAPLRQAFSQATADPRAFAQSLSDAGGRPRSIVYLVSDRPQRELGDLRPLVQEVQALRHMDIPARIAIPLGVFGGAPTIGENPEECFYEFADSEDLLTGTANADVIVATDSASAAMLEILRNATSDFLPAYLLHDYEPFRAAAPLAEQAIASYTAIPNMLLLARSHWLCNVLARRHGLRVAKVEHGVGDKPLLPAEEPDAIGPLRVAAMICPRLAHTQPHATVATLTRLLTELPGDVRVSTFGCPAAELRELGSHAEAILDCHRDPPTRHDPFASHATAAILSDCDVLLDMSVYRACGETALEAMACGATAVFPAVGGTSEIAKHDHDAIAVDTFDANSAYDALASLAGDRERLRLLRENARGTTARYPIARAALSQYLLFTREHRTRGIRCY
jgi:GT2 family glycosyltransferase